jgi:hypothetical protein
VVSPPGRRPDADRGRVPFALVGVLLLVTSAAFHGSLGAAPPVREPDAEAALERAGASVVPALRAAVRRAARAAAQDPVVTPANTSAGRALDDSRPFRDALRLRVYLAARAELRSVTVTEGSVRATARLPRVGNDRTTAVRRVIERVTVERVGPDGSRLRVRLTNVTLRAGREGRRLAREQFATTVTVRSPVLALHDRTGRYERRLDARTLDIRSAGARLTAGTYVAAYSRGTAQWAGVPISNVLANRHLALATDAAVYDAQARTFGAMDPEWRRGLATAARRALGADAANLAFGTAKRGRSESTTTAMDALQRALVAGSQPVRGTFGSEQVGVDAARSADAAFAALLRRPADGRRNLTRRLREAYTVDARLAARTERLRTTRSGDGGQPSAAGDWTLVDSRTTTDYRIDDTSVDIGAPETTDDWHDLWTTSRHVVRRTTTIRVWRDGERTTTTSSRTTARFRVALAVRGRHALPPGSDVPRRPVVPVHEPGGLLDGPNLADVRGRARERLVAGRGGVDALVRRAVTGTLDTEPVPVTGRRPAGLERRVVRDLTDLNRRVRNLSVTSSRRRLATFRGRPAAELAATVRARRERLLDAPGTYDGVADRARVAARAAYLDRVVSRLERRAERRRSARRRLNDSLLSHGLPSLDRIARLRAVADEARGRASDDQRRSIGPGRLVPDATPTHLSATATQRSRLDLRGGGEVRPLAARNLNVFTLPYGDAADFVRGGNRQSVPLGTAARTLRAARAATDRTGNRSVDGATATLRRAVEATNGRLRERLQRRLRRRGIEGVTRRRHLVGVALGRWETPAARALAFANGSAAGAVATVAAEHDGDHHAGSRDRLRLLLRDELRRALAGDAGRVREAPARRAGRLARDLLDAGGTQAARLAAERGADRATRRLSQASKRIVPAGLPVLPPVQPWYATLNVWHVHVRGVHPSFVVRARGYGGPGPPLTYERDGRAVRLDVDRDGTPERLGRATRVAFDIETAVLVVVPPGGNGVGDTGGNADERAGWPRPTPWPDRR